MFKINHHRKSSRKISSISEEKGNLIIKFLIATKTLGQRKILYPQCNPTFFFFNFSLYFPIMVKFGITFISKNKHCFDQNGPCRVVWKHNFFFFNYPGGGNMKFFNVEILKYSHESRVTSHDRPLLKTSLSGLPQPFKGWALHVFELSK